MASFSPNLGNSLIITIPATIISSVWGCDQRLHLCQMEVSRFQFAFRLVSLRHVYSLSEHPDSAHSVSPVGKTLWDNPGLISVHVLYGLPISSLIFRNYFANIPDELLEASRIDGAGIIRTFSHVMFPLSMPAFIVVGIFQFTNVWNDFLFGVTILPNPVAQPVTVALNNLSGSYSVDWNVVMAGAVIAALPTALVYILLGRFFVRGLLAGSVKG